MHSNKTELRVRVQGENNLRQDSRVNLIEIFYGKCLMFSENTSRSLL